MEKTDCEKQLCVFQKILNKRKIDLIECVKVTHAHAEHYKGKSKWKILR